MQIQPELIVLENFTNFSQMNLKKHVSKEITFVALAKVKDFKIVSTKNLNEVQDSCFKNPKNSLIQTLSLIFSKEHQDQIKTLKLSL